MTFSIVARDPGTGAFGVATATAGPAVGALVPHTRARHGAAATQAMTNPYLAIDTLAHLDTLPAKAALDAALAKDDGADRRQLIVVDASGRTAAWTGAQCIGFAGHIAEDNVAVAGNMLFGPAVIENMLTEFAQAKATGLAQALLVSLKAGAAAGSDSRGIGSASLLVQGSQAYLDIDLRVDFSIDPLGDLHELLKMTLAGPYASFFAEVPRR